MSGSKKARSTPSITNNTNIFGIMGGLAPRVGVSDVAVYRHQQIKGGRGLPNLNGKTPEAQQYYMKTHNLLSVNPVGSGGVGKKSNMYHLSCNCRGAVPPTLSQVSFTAAPSADQSPTFVFFSTQAGAITYGGGGHSTTTAAVAGNNTITFDMLTEGLQNYTITVTNSNGLISTPLIVPGFTVTLPPTPVITPTINLPLVAVAGTPIPFSFHSTHAGPITYTGATSSTTVAVAGSNTITFDAQSVGSNTITQTVENGITGHVSAVVSFVAINTL